MSKHDDPEGPERGVREVRVPKRALSRLRPLIGGGRYAQLEAVSGSVREILGDRTIWNVNSTSAGGGVAEMLQVLSGYALDAGVDVRWLVISGDPTFFAVTKRVHNRLYGVQGDHGDLGPAEARAYETVLAANTRSMLQRIRPGDIVLLHDPQTVGLSAALTEAGARVVWRCHVGQEFANEWTEQAWSFLRPYLSVCEAFIFSMRTFAPAWLPTEQVWVIPPSIDPFSPKNQDMDPVQVRRILGTIGLLEPYDEVPGTFVRRDETTGVVKRRASFLPSQAAPLEPDCPLVVQVSRWDRLKDMEGVMKGFASSVPEHTDAHLALVGPATGDVSDDPEGAEVFAECVAAWEELSPAARQRIRLVTLPMDDVDENAAMVNAIQRHSTVIVQKSLAEGFGLTVSEGMWKSRAVVASAVGGIKDQVVPGTGILLDDPTDLEAFGEALVSLLEHPEEVAKLGERAHRRVVDQFLGDRHLVQYAQLVESLNGWSAEAPEVRGTAEYGG
jgi:trehalose synthase